MGIMGVGRLPRDRVEGGGEGVGRARRGGLDVTRLPRRETATNRPLSGRNRPAREDADGWDGPSNVLGGGMEGQHGWATHFLALAFFEPFDHSASSTAAFLESSAAFLLAAASAFLACPAAFLLPSPPPPPPFLAIFVCVGWSGAGPVCDGLARCRQPRPDEWDLQLFV